MAYQPRIYLIGSSLWILSLTLSVIPGLLIRNFFDQLTQSRPLSISIGVPIALMLATELGRVATYLMAWIPNTQHRFATSSLIRRNLLDHLLSRPGAHPLTVSGEPSKTVSPGELISYFRDDAGQIENTIAQTSQVIGEVLYALVCLAILISIHAQMTLLVFLPLVVMVAIVQRAETRIKRYRQVSRQATQQVTGFVGEIFNSTQAIKIAGGQKQVLAYFRQINDQRRQVMLKDQLFTALLNSTFRSLANVGIGIILLLVAILIQSDVSPLTLGDLALFVYYLPFIIYAFQSFSEFMALLKQSQVSFERLAALSAMVKDRPAAIAPSGKQEGRSAAAVVAHHPLYLNNLLGQSQPLPPIDPPEWNADTHLHELRAHNLTYHYPGSDRGIENITLQLRRGSVTVITGPVGAGKTTLLRVLLGLLPKESGEIYWNRTRVSDPATFFVPPRSAYTPQVPRLFSDSLRDNLLLGLGRSRSDSAGVSPAELASAIEQAVFAPDVAAMPEGLNTLIGPKGVRLSGGQIQRAAAARMFVRQPELLVFDDLSSALDVETEQRLWQRLLGSGSMGEWERGGDGYTAHGARGETEPDTQHPPTPLPKHPLTPPPTLLIVSHRPWVLRHADQIIVLEGGRVHFAGSPQDCASAGVLTGS